MFWARVRHPDPRWRPWSVSAARWSADDGDGDGDGDEKGECVSERACVRACVRAVPFSQWRVEAGRDARWEMGDGGI